MGLDHCKIMISLKSRLDFGVIWPLNSHFGARITSTKYAHLPSLIGVRSPTALPPRFQGRNTPNKLQNGAVSRPNFQEVKDLEWYDPTAYPPIHRLPPTAYRYLQRTLGLTPIHVNFQNQDIILMAALKILD